MTRARAIAAFCYDCCGESSRDVAVCQCFDCALWRYRLGCEPQTDRYRTRLEQAFAVAEIAERMAEANLTIENFFHRSHNKHRRKPAAEAADPFLNA